ncbi:restriction endonuclease [Micavibrio aeruginosavorus]|uniref:Restriction endonuclease n=1 Tax=Micavibrio aeruginosavorus EPB TaxID=349215 RepID=M4VF15_9BACT|nr:restriction endonuclease [Micavibrio aeruginosavorus]AGH97818.1 hypothetical protein A11S_998 [Micavibrio aeruginosavorus EPB]
MNSPKRTELEKADLLVDRIYEGGRSGNASDDPLPKLIGVSNQGGFRYIGKKEHPRLVVLTSTLKNPDWPDNLDKESGIFTYYGDNKKPGYELHDTPRFGNLLLRDMFDRSHGSIEERILIPPILIFANTGNWRDVEFLGLAVPGVQNLDSNQDLVAVWKQKNSKRFQNYQAKFTILNTQIIPRKWLESVKQGKPLTDAAPSCWKSWIETKNYQALKAPRTLEYRSREEQLPTDETGTKLIALIQDKFIGTPHRFEACAAKIAEMMLQRVSSIDLTRPSRDGGRDAIGKYRIGQGASSVLVDFALEAKCYSTSNSVGVKELSRLISRLRNRQFGILVTTSYVATQAYQEIKEDEHPIVIISAIDIANTLKAAGITTEQQLSEWLSSF